jgi:hypothetical protein
VTIPADIQQSLRDYIAGKHPYPFGDFLTAVLANDLVGAFMLADENNVRIIQAYASFLYNKMPLRTGDPSCDFWGSYEAVSNRIREQRDALEAANDDDAGWRQMGRDAEDEQRSIDRQLDAADAARTTRTPEHEESK